MSGRSKRDARVVSAITACSTFLDEHLAASRIELEAKLIDSHFGHPPFEPTHLHDALAALQKRGVIRLDHTATRGGSTPPIFVTTSTAGRSRRVNDAMARKRLLMSRYYSYVQGGIEAGESLAGPAGERAFDAALGRARVGASIASTFRDLPSVPTIFGTPVPMGPLDNGFVLSPLDPKDMSPRGPFGITVIVEVKNIRQWIYPRTQELYQLLSKGAEISAMHPERAVLPLLVCRKAHFTTRKMAKDMGFFVIETQRQYLPESSLIAPELLEEIRTEIGVSDLVQGTTATRNTEKRLVTLQQHYDLETAIERWSQYATDATIRRCFRELHNDALHPTIRESTLNSIRKIVHEDIDQFSW